MEQLLAVCVLLNAFCHHPTAPLSPRTAARKSSMEGNPCMCPPFAASLVGSSAPVVGCAKQLLKCKWTQRSRSGSCAAAAAVKCSSMHVMPHIVLRFHVIAKGFLSTVTCLLGYVSQIARLESARHVCTALELHGAAAALELHICA